MLFVIISIITSAVFTYTRIRMMDDIQSIFLLLHLLHIMVCQIAIISLQKIGNCFFQLIACLFNNIHSMPFTPLILLLNCTQLLSKLIVDRWLYDVQQCFYGNTIR